MWTCLDGTALRNAQFRILGAAFAAALLTAFAPFCSWAEENQPIIRIEEDWVLVVGDPDPTTHGPQVATVFSPYGDVDCAHFMFLVNHRTLPDFTAGGLQVQAWNGDDPVASRNFPNNDLLEDEGETVTWTQSMSLNGGNLVFEVTNGTSNAWGGFGGEGYLRDAASTSLSSLSSYDPEVSTSESGVTFAANRVAQLVLKEVRYYSEEGLVARDTTERVVHQQ